MGAELKGTVQRTYDILMAALHEKLTDADCRRSYRGVPPTPLVIALAYFRTRLVPAI
jgi:hypothetical protein